MNYRSLAAHNAACNWIFYRFQDCENEHPYRRFLGYCDQIQKEMIACMKEQREIRRKNNVRHRGGRLENTKAAQQESGDN